MKSRRILVIVTLIATLAAFAASAAGFSLELGGVGYDFNSLGAPQASSTTTLSPVANFVSSFFMPSVDPYLNGSYTLTLDPTTKVKLGLMAEDMTAFGSSSFVSVGRAEPYATLSLGALTATASLPLYFIGYDATNDAKFTEIKYIFDKYYKGIYLGTLMSSANEPTFLFTNYESLAYKFSFDKTTSLTLSATTEIGISPAYVYDVKPQATIVFGPVQLDLKESIYFADQVAAPSFTDSAFATRYFTDPKLTFDFSSLGVKGLKAYLAASLYTANVSAAGTNFYGSDTVNGTASKSTYAALGSSVTPGVSFSMAPFYFEAAFKYSNYDDTDTDGITNKNPSFDPMLKLSYTLTF